jgi:hypothetical protein
MAQHDETLHRYDQYISALFAEEDAALRAAREDMQRAGLPPINVSASEAVWLVAMLR